MQEKILKFEKILEKELEKEMDKIIAANTLTPSDVSTMKDAVKLMLKVKEYKECCDEEENSYGYNDGYSTRRGRSMTTGRYVSRDPGYSMMRGSYNRGSYDQGYSGHDMRARMIDQLEELYSEAHDEKDRMMLDEWIRRFETSR